MNAPQPDSRNVERKLRDEQLASEPPIAPPEIPGDLQPQPMEKLLRRRPLAVMGVVENGLVRLLDPQIKLPEQSRVIIVTSESV